MSIISLSLDEKTEDKIEEIMNESAFGNRSELVRKAITDIHNKNVSSNLQKSGKALMVVKHPHETENQVSELLHESSDIIQTQLHSKLDEENCVEFLLLEADPENIEELRSDLKGSKSTERVELISL